MDPAEHLLLAPAGLDVEGLAALVAEAAGGAIELADLYLEHSRQQAFQLEEGRVRSGSHAIAAGFGVRAVAGEATGFAYGEEINAPAIRAAARTARAIAGRGTTATVSLVPRAPAPLYPADDPIDSALDADKVHLLERVDRAARAFDPRVDQVVATLAASHQVVVVAQSDGELVADSRPLVRLSISVVARTPTRCGRGSAGGGGRSPFALFTGELDPETLARAAARQAIVNLAARPAPAGTMAVVLGPGWPGILLHEAVGHGLEGDFNRKGSSAFAGRLGQRVAAPGVTVVDDATLMGRRGSLSADDEGTPPAATVLIDDGILVGYLQDRHNGHLMGQPSTGNGRRQSFAHLPIPRMTNTFMRGGEVDPQEILASVDDGLYAVQFSGGQVDITSGKFVFAASEAYRIRAGKLAEPVRDATLIGDGPDCLTKVTLVGNDLALDLGIGTCSKGGQMVPVGVGLPTVKLSALTVGGTGG